MRYLNGSHTRVVRYLSLTIDDVELGARVRVRGENRQPHAVHDVRGDGGGNQQARFQSAIGGRTVAHVEHGRKDVAPAQPNGSGQIAAVARHTVVLREEGHYTLGVSIKSFCGTYIVYVPVYRMRISTRKYR